MLPSLFFFVLFVPFVVNFLSYLVAAKGRSAWIRVHTWFDRFSFSDGWRV